MQAGSKNNFLIQKEILLLHRFIFEFMITDLSYLQQMTGNEREVMNEMIELFLNQLTEMREDIDLLANSKNWIELSRMAHKIKSSALVMGIVQMADEMKELELLAKEGKNVEKYPDYVAHFKALADLAEVELKTYLDG